MATGDEISELVRQALADHGSARTDLAAAVDAARAERDGRAVDALVGPVAAQSAGGSVEALAVLLFLIDRCNLADRALWSVLSDPLAVEDAAQETVLAVARGISTFRGEARFTTWLHRVAYNAGVAVARQRKLSDGPLDGDVSGMSRSLSSIVTDRVAIERAVADLPPIFREPLVLREFDQLEYVEIADRLGLPLGTVRSRIARARSHLAIRFREAVPT